MLTACVDAPRWTSDIAGADVRAVVDQQHFSLAHDTLSLSTPGRAAIVMRTTTVALGGRTLDVAPLDTAVDEETLDLVRAEFVETFEVNDEGVAQSWGFPRRPDTAADLVVTVDVAEVTAIDRVEDGLRLRRAGEVDVFYGDATFIDAAGGRTAVPSTYARDRIVLAVPASVVAAASFPAILDPQMVITPTAN
ncbi:MAG: hypothetical protein ACKV2T_15875 [Kofleriaceae bacterium]